VFLIAIGINKLSRVVSALKLLLLLQDVEAKQTHELHMKEGNILQQN
jgi:hypothetical protein